VLLRTNFSFAFRALISIRHFGTQSAGSEDYAQFKVGNIFLSLEFEIRTFVSYVIVHRQKAVCRSTRVRPQEGIYWEQGKILTTKSH
jgi:hypothetical protein